MESWPVGNFLEQIEGEKNCRSVTVYYAYTISHLTRFSIKKNHPSPPTITSEIENNTILFLYHQRFYILSLTYTHKFKVITYYL